MGPRRDWKCVLFKPCSYDGPLVSVISRGPAHARVVESGVVVLPAGEDVGEGEGQAHADSIAVVHYFVIGLRLSNLMLSLTLEGEDGHAHKQQGQKESLNYYLNLYVSKDMFDLNPGERPNQRYQLK